MAGTRPVKPKQSKAKQGKEKQYFKLIYKDYLCHSFLKGSQASKTCWPNKIDLGIRYMNVKPKLITKEIKELRPKSRSKLIKVLLLLRSFN